MRRTVCSHVRHNDQRRFDAPPPPPARRPRAWRLMGMYGDRKAQQDHCVLCGNNLTAAQHGAKWLPGQVRAKIAITSQQQVINKVIVKPR